METNCKKTKICYEICLLCGPLYQAFWSLFPFFESGPRFGGEVKPGSEQSEKRDNNSQKRVKKRVQLSYEFYVFCNICFSDFWSSSWEVFFSALMAKVSRKRTTWGHFSRHVAAKLESSELGFRVHQTLLFRDLRRWIRTCWATCFKIFSKMALEALVYDFLRN